MIYMRILQNVTRQELDLYAAQPTAKAMHERVTKDSVFVPAGDKNAAAVFISSRDAQKIADKTDKVEISRAGQELSDAQENAKDAAKSDATDKAPVLFNVSKQSSSNKFSVSFNNIAMLNRAVEQGYIETDGMKITLSDDVKKQLLAAGKQVENARQAVAMHNMMLHEAANARQTNDAFKKSNDMMSRAMSTASRIMHGKKVSPADEKELMEFNKDLYMMAKNAAALEQHRRKKDDKEDERISAANDEARAKEAEPKDYSVEEMPMPQAQVQMDVSFDGEAPQIANVGAEISQG